MAYALGWAKSTISADVATVHRLEAQKPHPTPAGASCVNWHGDAFPSRYYRSSGPHAMYCVSYLLWAGNTASTTTSGPKHGQAVRPKKLGFSER